MEETNLTNSPELSECCPSYDHSGNYIVYSGKESKDDYLTVFIMNSDGSEQKRVTNNPAEDRWPCWSPLLPPGN